MPTPSDISLEKSLYSDSSTEVHLARFEGRLERVLVKRFRAGGQAAAVREARLFERLSGPGVPRLIELHDDADEPVLVLQGIDATPLSARLQAAPIAVAELLSIGIGIASITARIHAARLIHLSLNPTTIWVSDDGCSSFVVDFRKTRGVEEQVASPAELQRLQARADELRYVSPEATGRMGIGADARSDLYALGVCLFHLAVGRAPFVESDPLALIHAHMARPAPQVSEFRGDFPLTVGRIISKLLEKAPDDRYQTAVALLRDLKLCRERLETGQSIPDDLALARADAPTRPSFSKRLYGREAEIAVVEQAAARLRAGEGSALLIHGASGIGKSSLVELLRAPVVEAGGVLARGKFDLQGRDLPYSALVEALHGVVHQILTESDTRLTAWRQRLREVMGPVAGALLDIVPDLELLMPGLSPLRALRPNQTLARLSLAMRRFVRALADASHPLVLFLDDLQWADAGSLELLRELLVREELPHMAFVGAYREVEPAETSQLSELIHGIQHSHRKVFSIALAPIDERACAGMLAAAFACDMAAVRDLAAVVGRKTANNPLVIEQFVTHMHDLHLIRFELDRGWVFDLERIADEAIPDGAVQLISARIDRLSADACGALELVACAGDGVELELLDAVAEMPCDSWRAGLDELFDEGLLVRSGARLCFAHDRIREVAQERMDAERAADLHLRIVRPLLEREPLDAQGDRAISIADHLHHARALVPSELYAKCAQMNQLAGTRALESGAASTGLVYLERALAWLDRAGCAEDASASFSLRMSAAEASIQLAELDRADELLRVLYGAPLPLMQDVAVSAKQIEIASLRISEESQAASLALVRRTLKRFGLRWSVAPSRLRARLVLAYTDWLLRGGLGPDRFRAHDGRANDWLAPLMILGAGSRILARASGLGTFMLSAYTLRSFLRNGCAMSPGASLAGYAAFRHVVTGNAKGIERFGVAALEWAERLFDPVNSPRTQFVVHGMAFAWTRPRRESVEPLCRARESALEAGDVEYALYLWNAIATRLALCGYPLDRLQRELEADYVYARKSEFNIFDAYATACDWLCNRLPHAAELEAINAELLEAYDRYPASRLGCWPFWVTVLCMIDRYDLAHGVCEANARWAFGSVASGALLADFTFLRGLIAATRARASRRGRGKQLRVLGSSLRWLRTWARDNADFEPLAQALRGERLALRGRVRESMRISTQAAERAAALGYVQYAGLIHERTATMLQTLSRQVEADRARRRAIDACRQWGADALAQHLARRSVHG